MHATRAFSHEALFYAGDGGFVDGTAPFIRAAVAAGEPILVVVGARKIALLREELGAEARHVEFADMAEVGTNPAHIIPAWRDFVHDNAGRGLWGIGEPVYPERGPAELVECQRHESLLNLAFADTPGFRLLCPYDTDALGPDVIHEARCSHPVIFHAGDERPSADYRGLDAVALPFDDPLPTPPAEARELPFGSEDIDAPRTLAAERAAEAGLGPSRVEDLAVAVQELVSNTIRHGGGRGVFRLWEEPGAVVCEVTDAGRIEDPLVGRVQPLPGQGGGFGLWIANQLCDLVQVRCFANGSAVRLHMRLS